MLDPTRMKALLSLNIDDRASHFVLFTNHGTLLSHDNDIDVPSTRSFAALIGLTWRHHAEAFALSNGTKAAPDVQHVNTLRLIRKPGTPNEIQAIVLEWQGVVAAVQELRPKVLLAAQLPIEAFDGQTDKISQKIQAITSHRKTQVAEGEDAGENTNEDTTQALEATTGSLSQSAATSAGGNATSVENSKGKSPSNGTGTDAEENGNHKGGVTTDGSSSVGNNAGESKPKATKSDVLLIRAKVLAQVLLEEWPDQVPDDFF